MRTLRPFPVSLAGAGFTMIEMIGVMAILAIMATVLVPNGLRAIDRAAIIAEAKTLRGLGEQAKIYLKSKGAPPGLSLPVRGWNIDLAEFADLSPTDVLVNKRQVMRAYIYEPVATPKRLLIISCMRSLTAGGVPVAQPLPRPIDLNTVARFDHVWNTPDDAVPEAGADAWAGWASWRLPVTANGGDYLVIERVNFAPIYSTDLKDFVVTLNNKTPAIAGPTTPAVGGKDVSYTVTLANGQSQGRVTVFQLPAAPTAPINPAAPPSRSFFLRPGDRIDLFTSTTATTPDSSYVISTSGKSFDFNGSTWIPQ